MRDKLTRREFLKLSLAVCGAITLSQYSIKGKIEEYFRKIEVAIVGCGGAGNNIISELTKMKIRNAELIAINTDKISLEATDAHKKVLIGYETTRGLGTGGSPEIGEKSAIEAKNRLKEFLYGKDLVFILAGMGGGTGSGSAPVVAEIAKKIGAFTVGVVTMPFNFERSRINKAKKYLAKLKEYADSVVVVDQNKVLEYMPNIQISTVFKVVDKILAKTVKEITEAINVPILINLNFNDVKDSMKGFASIGVGSGRTVKEAVAEAFENLLFNVSYKDICSAIVHIISDKYMIIKEINSIKKIANEYLSTKIIYSAKVCTEYKRPVEVITIASLY